MVKIWLKRNYYRIANLKKGIKIGKHVILDINNTFEGHNVIADDCEIASSKIGLGTYISKNSVIKMCLVGRFCSIGRNIQTGLGLHPTEGFVSSHPAFFSSQRQAGFSFVTINKFIEHKYIDEDGKYIIQIGNDVWIGNNVILMDGIRIGDGAIIAAGSIVTKDVDPYTIVAGIPAKFLRYKFSEAEIEALRKIKWWNWPFEKIRAHHQFFDDINLFLNNI
jgi:acetyltransferase-like isoleucine patch superfamily enzyme